MNEPGALYQPQLRPASTAAPAVVFIICSELHNGAWGLTLDRRCQLFAKFTYQPVDLRLIALPATIETETFLVISDRRSIVAELAPNRRTITERGRAIRSEPDHFA